MKVVNQPVMKKDAMALVTGKPVFTDDKAPKDCLIVKLLRSPCDDQIDQYPICYESAGNRGNLYMGRRATGTFHDGRTDLSRVKSI